MYRAVGEVLSQALQKEPGITFMPQEENHSLVCSAEVGDEVCAVVDKASDELSTPGFLSGDSDGEIGL